MQEEREGKTMNPAVSKMQDAKKTDVLKKDKSTRKKNVINKDKKEIQKENGKKMHNTTKNFIGGGNFITNAIRRYKERREGSKPYRTQGKLKKKSQKNPITNRIRNYGQRFAKYLNRKFPNDDDDVSDVLHEDPNLSLKDKTAFEKMVGREMSETAGDSDQSEDEIFIAGTPQVGSKSNRANWTAQAGKGEKIKHVDSKLNSPKQDLQPKSPVLERIKNSYLFPETQQNIVDELSDSEVNSCDPYFEGELPTKEELDKTEEAIYETLPKFEVSSDFSEELPAANRIEVKADIEPREPQQAQHSHHGYKVSDRFRKRYVFSTNSKVSTAEKLPENSTNKKPSASPKWVYYATPAATESTSTGKSTKVFNAIPVRIDPELSESSCGKFLEPIQIEFDGDKIVRPHILPHMEKASDPESNRGILDMEISPSLSDPESNRGILDREISPSFTKKPMSPKQCKFSSYTNHMFISHGHFFLFVCFR